MINVAALWRHPIKSHGREELTSVVLQAGQTMPWDRHWAVTHEDSKFDHADPRWIMCRNFMIGVATPGLAGIWASLDDATGMLTLRHEECGEHRFHPDNPDDLQGFLDWVTPLCPPNKRQPRAIVKAPDRGMTDSNYASVSIMNLASHRAVEAQIGHPLSVARWRGNIWIQGLAPWQEFNWVGNTIRFGDAELRIEEPIERCMATAANPQTGVRDADTLAALRDGWDHQNFGIYATVTKGGKVALQDEVKVI